MASAEVGARTLSAAGGMARALTWPALLTGWIPLLMATEGLIGAISRDDWLAVIGNWILVGLSMWFYWLWPALLLLPIALPVALLWKTPRRIVLLRPFERRESSRTLVRLASNVFARYGHTYTLSDSNIQMPWFVRIPLLLGQLRALTFSFPVVDSNSRLNRLERALSDRRGRNLNWLLASRHLFAVRSHSDFWQHTVDVLLSGADLIVLDLTDLKPGVLWEVERCRARDLMPKVVLLCSSESEAGVGAWLEREGLVDVKLHVYTRQRSDWQSLDREVARQLGGAPKERTAFRGVIAVAGVVVAMVALFWALRLQSTTALSKYAPRLTVRASPFAEHVYAVYQSTFDTEDNELRREARKRLELEFPRALVKYARGDLEREWGSSQGDLPRLAALLEVVRAHGERNDATLLRELLAKQELPAAYRDVVGTIIALEEDPWNEVLADLVPDSSQCVAAASAAGHHRFAGAQGRLEAALSDDVCRPASAWALAKTGAHSSVPLLLMYVDEAGFLSPKTPVRDALDILVDSSSVEGLIRALDREGAKRRYAVEALARVGDTRAVVPLFEHFAGHGFWTRDPVQTALDAIVTNQDVPSLLAFVTDPREKAAAWAVDTLTRLQDPRAFEALFEIWLEKRTPRLRSALVASASSDHVPFLIEKLRSRGTEVRELARQTLGHLKDARAINPLLADLARERKAFCVFNCPYSAAMALDAILTRDHVPLLIGRLRRSKSRFYVERKLVELGDCTTVTLLVKKSEAALAAWVAEKHGGCTTQLASALRSRRGVSARTAVAVLGNLGGDESRELLLGALVAGVEGSQEELGDVIRREDLPWVVRLLNHESAAVRRFALAEIRSWGGKQHLDDVARLTSDPDPAVRREAERTRSWLEFVSRDG